MSGLHADLMGGMIVNPLSRICLGEKPSPNWRSPFRCMLVFQQVRSTHPPPAAGQIQPATKLAPLLSGSGGGEFFRATPAPQIAIPRPSSGTGKASFYTPAPPNVNEKCFAGAGSHPRSCRLGSISKPSILIDGVCTLNAGLAHVFLYKPQCFVSICFGFGGVCTRMFVWRPYFLYIPRSGNFPKWILRNAAPVPRKHSDRGERDW